MLTNNHCGKSGCICLHVAPCEFGWIWVETYDEVKVKSPDGTKVRAEKVEGVQFCPTCSPERAALQRTLKTGQELGEALRARSNATRLKVYEERESGKTRTL
jgi:hypothetical protein